MSETQTPVDEAFLRDFKDMQRQLQDVRNASVGGASFVTGDLVPSAAATRPGCLLCDGTAVSRTDYAALFGVISTTFGTGDGSTTFNLPDYRGRAIIGVGTGSGLTTRTLGTAVGTETHTLTATESGAAAHAHPAGTTGAGSSHTHSIPNLTADLLVVSAAAGTGGSVPVGANSGTPYTATRASTTGAEAAHTHSFTTPTSTGVAASSAHNNMPPSQPAYIHIKT